MKKLNPANGIIGIIFYILSAQYVSAGYILGTYYNNNDIEIILMRTLFILVTVIIITKILKKIIAKSDKFNIHGLVLSKYSSNSDSTLFIEARKGGIWNFIMTKTKIDNKVSITIDSLGRNIICEVYNLNGYNRTIVNIDDITSFGFEYRRNLVTTTIVGIILFIVLFIKPWIAILGGIGLAVWFFLTKNFILELETVSGTKLSFGFSTSVIEHLHMDKIKGENIQDILVSLKNKK